MHNLRIVVAIILALISTIYVFAQSSENFKNEAFWEVCYTYVGTNKQPSTGWDVKIWANWELIYADPYSQCAESNMLCCICFDQLQLTFNDAVNILGDYLDQVGGWVNVPSSDPFIVTGWAGEQVQVFKMDEY